jgi:hypothetical protein
MTLPKVEQSLIPLLNARAKREHKSSSQLLNEILRIALWYEPEVLFKGKSFQVNPDLFNQDDPSKEQMEDFELTSQHN